jgi:zinc protease
MFPDHPYGRPADGTEESLDQITDDDLRAFVGSRLSRDKLVIGVVGDITADELAPFLESTFAGLPASDTLIDAPDVVPQTDGGVIVEPVNAPQSAIVFAQPGLDRADPDYYAFTVLNEILGGGGMTSKLFQEVREARGLAYSVYARPAPFDHTALYIGGAGTMNERAHETVAVIREQWRLVAESGFSADEVTNAKQHLTGSFPLRFTSNGRVARTLVGMQIESLGIDYIDQRNNYIEAVSLEDVNRLATSLLDPEALTFVVAGQPTGFPTE